MIFSLDLSVKYLSLLCIEADTVRVKLYKIMLQNYFKNITNQSIEIKYLNKLHLNHIVFSIRPFKNRKYTVVRRLKNCCRKI